MPLLFFIDKEFLEDPACRNLDDVVLSYTFFRYIIYHHLPPCYSYPLSARRNGQGHLEPDAPDDVVQASQGFGDYEMAPRVEDRNPASEPTVAQKSS